MPARAPEPLFGIRDYVIATAASNYDVAPDGRFIFVRLEAADETGAGATGQLLVVVQNLFDELQRLLPTH